MESLRNGCLDANPTPLRVTGWPGSTATRTASRTSGPPTCSTSPTGRARSPRGTAPGSWSTSAAAPPAPPPRSSARPQLAWDTWARGPGSPTPRGGRTPGWARRRRAFVAAYVDGVNAGLHADAPELSRLGIEPAAVGAVDAARRLPRPAPALRRACRPSSGTTAPGPCSAPTRRCSSRDPAYSSGSNAWAVGGARTASGHAADRRRPAPGHRVARRLPAGAAGDATSSTSSASPSRACPACSTSRTPGEVAWAITNAMADYQDVYEESLDDVVDGREETIAVRGADPVTVEVLATERGPLFEIDRDGAAGSASATPRRCSATSASTRCSRCCAPAPSTTSTAPSTPGSSRSTTWSSPTGTATVRFRIAGRVPVRAEREPARHRRRAASARHLDRLARPAAPRRAAGRPGRHRQRAARAARARRSAPTFAPPHRARPDPRAARGRADLTAGGLRRRSTTTRSPAALAAVRAASATSRPARGGAGPRRDPGAGTAGWTADSARRGGLRRLAVAR